MRQLARAVREGEDKAREIAFSSARARLAQALCSSAKKIENRWIVRTARKELAQIAGIAQETCVRLVQKLEAEKMVKRDGRKALFILDPDALGRAAGGALAGSQ